MPRLSFRCAFTALLCLVSNSWLSAQTPSATGSLTGRVLNPATGEYVRNAQIRLVETGATTVSEAEGLYTLNALPAGPLTLVVTYTGYRTVTTPVEITRGATTTKNIELISTLQDATTASDGTVKLAAFTVATEREGNAKAIMDQRNS